jgi:hypothetical protein
MKELFEVSIPWVGCKHQWVSEQDYWKALDATFTFYRRCSVCGAEETRSLPEFARLMGINLTKPESVV